MTDGEAGTASSKPGKGLFSGWKARAQSRADKRHQKEQVRELEKKSQAALTSGKNHGKAVRELERAEKRRAKDIASRIKSESRELGKATEQKRIKRRHSKGVYDAIAFGRMFRNGICEVEEGLFSETVEFDDISYQSAKEEDQRNVLNAMTQMLNYFGADSTVQYTVVNEPLREDEIGNRMFFDPDACGENAPLAEEFNWILNEKMRQGSSNIRRRRFITYATAAEDADRAAQRLYRMRQNVRQTFSGLRSKSHVLDGRARLELISSIVNPQAAFEFDYSMLSLKSPLTAKDFVCPTTLDFKPEGSDSYFKADGMWCQVLVMLPTFSSQLYDWSIANVMDLKMPLMLTWHLQPVDKAKTKEMILQQAAWIQKDIIDNQKTAIQQGYDYMLLPPELEDYKNENERLLDLVEHKGQRLFMFSGAAFTYARTKEELDDQVVDIIRTCRQNGIELAPYRLRQREGMNSMLPLAHNHIDIIRDFVSSEAAILLPFTTQELDMPGGGYYGQNQLSGNLILVDRKSLMNPHGFVSGTSGSGKSFVIKQEIENTILTHPNDRIFIFDRTDEYSEMVRENHGVIYSFGPDADTFCNPFDMADVTSLSYQAAIAWKIDATLAMISALRAESNDGLTQEEKSIVSSCVQEVYTQTKANGQGMPLLSDLVDELGRFEGDGSNEARRLKLLLSRFVGNSPNAFLDHPSTIDFESSSIVSFNVKDVPNDMIALTLLANLESVRQQMLVNSEEGVSTWLYVDEIESLFQHAAVINYLARLWREGRKYGLICTGMTQSAHNLDHGGSEASAIVDQSNFNLLLRQSARDKDFWQRKKGLSDDEVRFIDEGLVSTPGYGLLIADSARVPFAGDFPQGTRLYEMFSTSPEDVAARALRNANNRKEG